MALALENKARLARMKLPTDAVVRPRLERWLVQTGRTDADVAGMIAKPDGCSYSRAAVNLYRLGRYPGAENEANTRAIRAALVELLDANPTVMERRQSGETHDTEARRKVHRAFRNALQHAWAYRIDGAPGTQKTHLLLSECAELEAEESGKNGRARRALYVRCRPRMSRRDLLAEISLAAGIFARGEIGQMIRRVRHHFFSRGARTLLVLDEAQQLDNYGLETLREFMDEPPYFGLLLAGSHDLGHRFLQLEQWDSRIENTVTLTGPTAEELRKIWTKEVGPLNEKGFKMLEAFCRVRDRRKSKDAPDAFYFSARKLFFAIKQKRQAKGDDDGN